MDDHSCMYHVLPEGLHTMNYCNRVKGFINYALFNQRNISRGVLDVHVRDIKKLI